MREKAQHQGAVVKWLDNQGSDNTAAVITISALAEERWAVIQIFGSYDATPTGGKVTVTSAGVTIFEIDLPAAGPFNGLLGDAPIQGGKNEDVVITLAAGGSGKIGKLNVAYK